MLSTTIVATHSRSRWRATRLGCYARVFGDPQVRQRGLVQYLSDAELGGEIPHIRTPVRIDEGVRVRAIALKLRRHNAQSFAGLRAGRNRGCEFSSESIL
jgi:hypothetical protein